MTDPDCTQHRIKDTLFGYLSGFVSCLLMGGVILVLLARA